VPQYLRRRELGLLPEGNVREAQRLAEMVVLCRAVNTQKLHARNLTIEGAKRLSDTGGLVSSNGRLALLSAKRRGGRIGGFLFSKSYINPAWGVVAVYFAAIMSRRSMVNNASLFLGAIHRATP
jgi:hypothetical protein